MPFWDIDRISFRARRLPHRVMADDPQEDQPPADLPPANLPQGDQPIADALPGVELSAHPLYADAAASNASVDDEVPLTPR